MIYIAIWLYVWGIIPATAGLHEVPNKNRLHATLAALIWPVSVPVAVVNTALYTLNIGRK